MSEPPHPIPTPCIKVCVGCYRTLTEVAAWARLDQDVREGILRELPSRPDRVRPEKRAMFGRP
jgi:predicted Fe-S protein YdhL (DUF1289 family)